MTVGPLSRGNIITIIKGNNRSIIELRDRASAEVAAAPAGARRRQLTGDGVATARVAFARWRRAAVALFPRLHQPVTAARGGVEDVDR